MKRFRLISVVLVVCLFSLIMSPLSSSTVLSASLTTVAVALGNENTGQVTSMTITFTPNTAITNGSVIEVTYDDDFTGGAALSDADIAVTGVNITSSVESGFAAGFFRSTLTTGGDVTTTVSIAIDNSPGLTTPGSAGNYNVGVAVDIGGAGTTFDYGAGLAYVENDNDVTVTATVPSTIDMEIYEQNSAAKTNACALGVLSLTVVKTCVYDIGGATNASAGMTVKIDADDALNDGSGNTIDDVADGTVSAGSEEYGVMITDDGATDQWAGSGTFEASDTAVPTSETTFASTSAVIDAINNIGDRMEVSHRAAMATNTVIGNYDQLVTYTAYTN